MRIAAAGTRRRRASLSSLGALLAAASFVATSVAPAAAATTVPSKPRSVVGTAGPQLGQVGITWVAPSSAGGSPILDYSMQRSTDGGTVWNTVGTFAPTPRSASSLTTPAIACPLAGTSSNLGCKYRVLARSAIGMSVPSNVVTLWTLPSAPSKPAGGPVDASYASAALQWTAPTNTGGFTAVSYVVQRSDDGGAFADVATTSGLTATVSCAGALSCAYRVIAVNGQGRGPASTALSITTTPGSPQSLQLLNTSTDLGTGVSTLAVSWRPPTTGMAAVSYLYARCRVAPGALTGCTATSAAWSAPVSVAATGDLNTRSETCTDADASCYVRVAAVNSRGGIGAWRTVNLQPWAPFNVSATPGPNFGDITIKFGGPSETGPNGAPKFYEAFVCSDNNCTNNTSWRAAGLSIPYPPIGTSPYTAGTYACGANVTCQVRMQFTAGNGAKGPVSRPASANGFSLNVQTPADGSSTNDNTPLVSGICTIGGGTVTATVLPGPVSFTTACTAAGTWSASVPTSLADGPYTVRATQAGVDSNVNAFTVDTTLPVVTVTSPSAGATLTDPDVTLSGTCSENGRPVTVTITGSVGTVLTTTCTSGTWTTSQVLPNGSYSVTAAQTDAAGNTGTSAPRPFTVASTNAIVTVQTPAHGALVTTTQPTFTGFCTTSAGTVTVDITGATTVTRTTSCTASAWTVTPALLGVNLNQGLHSVVASQTSGSLTITSDANGFRVDSIAPVTTDNTASFGSAWRNTNTTVTLVPTDPTPGSGVAATYYTTDGSTPTTASAQGTSIALTTNGVYTIKYFSKDNAGNVEAVKTASTVIRIDKTAPTIAITFPVNGQRYNATRWVAGCPTTGICGTAGDALSGLSSVGVTIRRNGDGLYWNGSAWAAGPVVVTPTGTNTWSVSLPTSALTDGAAYTVTATATDQAGNTASATSNFVYDTTGPHVTTVTATNRNWAVNIGDTFVVTFDDLIDPASIPSTATLTMTNNGGDCNNVVTMYQISALSAGSASTGSCGYIKGTGNTLNTITWDGTMAVSGNTVTFTVTTACQQVGCAAALTTTAPNANRQHAFSYTPAATISDAAGNAIVATTTSVCLNGPEPCGAIF